MTRREVISRFCALATKVRKEVFGNDIPADCICMDQIGFEFNETLLKYIEEAVYKQIDLDNKE